MSSDDRLCYEARMVARIAHNVSRYVFIRITRKLLVVVRAHSVKSSTAIEVIHSAYNHKVSFILQLIRILKSIHQVLMEYVMKYSPQRRRWG